MNFVNEELVVHLSSHLRIEPETIRKFRSFRVYEILCRLEGPDLDLLEFDVEDLQIASYFEEKPSQYAWLLKEMPLAISSLKLITESQAEMFLCVLPHNKTLSKWQTYSLACLLKHADLFGRDARLERAFSSFRLLCQTPDLAKLEHLSAQLNSHISQTKYRPFGSRGLNKLLTEIDPIFKKWISPLFRVMKDVYDQRLGNKKSKYTSTRKHEPTTTTNTLEWESQTGDAYSTPIEYIAPQAAIKNTNINEEELRVDNATSRRYAVADLNKGGFSKNILRSPDLQRYANKSVLNHIERREKSLPTLWGKLTQYEIHILFSIYSNYQIHNLDDIPPNKYLCCAAIIYMLLSGCNLRELWGRQRNISLVPNQLNLSLNFTLPQHITEEPFSQLLDQSGEPVVLQLPFLFKNTAGEYPTESQISHFSMAVTVTNQDLQEFLTIVNKKYKTRLTVKRITSYLPDTLIQKGVDSVYVALITGKKHFQPAGIYYQKYKPAVVADIYHKDFLLELLPLLSSIGKIEPSNLASTSGKTKDLRGGTKLKLKKNFTSKLFSHLKLQVQQSDNLIDFHNKYTLYVIALLNLCTGHRPVKEPYDDLNSFDLANKKIHISDKEIRLGDASRTLVLPNIAISQVEFYFKHLKAIHFPLSHISSQLANFLDKVIDGNAQFFFFIDVHKRNLVRITPEVLAYEFSNFFKLPQNWHRHYLRTILSEQQINSEIIDAWMGHEKLGQEGLSVFSGLSMRDLSQVAEFIDYHCQQNNIESLAGWT